MLAFILLLGTCVQVASDKEAVKTEWKTYQAWYAMHTGAPGKVWHSSYVPVFVSPTMQWNVPSSNFIGPPIGPGYTGYVPAGYPLNAGAYPQYGPQ